MILPSKSNIYYVKCVMKRFNKQFRDITSYIGRGNAPSDIWAYMY